MKIHVYSVCYNEEFMLPYFMKHYLKFADKITVYDKMSTDKSVELMKENGIEVIPFQSNNEYCESILLNIRNTCWKNDTSDFVIVCDIDEFIYHPNIIDKFIKYSNNGFTIIKPKGFQMMSESLPTTNDQIYDELKNGFFDERYSKPCIFNPRNVNIQF